MQSCTAVTDFSFTRETCPKLLDFFIKNAIINRQDSRIHATKRGPINPRGNLAKTTWQNATRTLRGTMKVTQIPQGTSVLCDKKNVNFKTGAGFRVELSRGQLAVIRKNEKLPDFFREMKSIAKVHEYHQGNLTMIFKEEPSDWLHFFKAIARHRRSIDIAQIWAFLVVIRMKSFEAEGNKAFTLIKALYSLTPGSRHKNNTGLPELTTEDLGKVRVKKEFDEEFGKVTVRLFLPDGELVARMYGKDSKNIKHLGEVFAGEADVHFHIETIVKPASVEALI